MSKQSIILFDGVCNFCNCTVNFLIKRDLNSALKFAPLQSNIANQLLKNHGTRSCQLDSFVLIENKKVYTRSTAALRVCRHLNGLWPLMYCFIIIPKPIRDGLYDWIANNRYDWLGKKDKCMIPTPDIEARFLFE